MLEKPDKHILVAVVYGIAAAVIWGLFPSVTKIGMASQLSTYDIIALRFIVAGAILSPLVYKKGFGGISWKAAFLFASGAGFMYLLFVIGGLIYSSAGHMGIITPSCMLLFSTTGSVLLLQTKLSHTRILGIVIIVIGIALIGFDSFQNISGSSWIGDLMFIGGGFLWASYTLGLKVWPLEPLHATAIVSVLSLILYLPAYFIFADVGIFNASLGDVIFQGFLQGILIAIAALLFYTKAVNILGAARGAVFGALVPASTILLAIPMLGDIPNSFQITGVIIVTTGMVFALGLAEVTKNKRKAGTSP